MKFDRIALIIITFLWLILAAGNVAEYLAQGEQRQPTRPQLQVAPLNNSGWQLIEFDYHGTRHVYLFHSRAEVSRTYAETLTKVTEIPIVRQ